MISTLARQGTGSFSYTSLRTYDAWGVRLGAPTGDPKGRYCADLGHKQDDESGLVYMRARFYEPLSGRFLSEDPASNGNNWFGYCSSNPISSLDFDGKAHFNEDDVKTAEINLAFFYLAIGMATLSACLGWGTVVTVGILGVAVFAGAIILGCTSYSMAQQEMLQAPAIMSLLVVLASGIKPLAANMFTSVLAGLLTAQVVLDIAALLDC